MLVETFIAFTLFGDEHNLEIYRNCKENSMILRLVPSPIMILDVQFLYIELVATVMIHKARFVAEP